MVAVENTPGVHNLVVCTLCSCYPWPVLGLPPVWYKSAPYRSRAVIDPRGVLAEFGTELPEDVEVRVWDSTAEVRYLVIPERPAGTEGLGEDGAGRAGHPRRHDRDDAGCERRPRHGRHARLRSGRAREPTSRCSTIDWEGRVHALNLASPTRGNIDAGRHQIELIPPADYLRMSYYEKWLTRVERAAPGRRLRDGGGTGVRPGRPRRAEVHAGPPGLHASRRR